MEYGKSAESTMFMYTAPLSLGDGDFGWQPNPAVTIFIVVLMTLLASFTLSGTQYVALKKSGVRCDRWLLNGTLGTAAGLGVVVLYLYLEPILSPSVKDVLNTLPNGLWIATGSTSGLVYGWIQGKILCRLLFRAT